MTRIEIWGWFTMLLPVFLVMLRAFGPALVARWPSLDKPVRVALRVGPDLAGGAKLASGAWDPAVMARTAYEAYLLSSGGLNYQGKPCPTWDELPQAIRDHWIASTSAIVTLRAPS
jgi:hypothetical protein